MLKKVRLNGNQYNRTIDVILSLAVATSMSSPPATEPQLTEQINQQESTEVEKGKEVASRGYNSVEWNDSAVSYSRA